MCCIFQKMLLHRLADFVTLCDTEMIKSTHLSKHAEFIFSVFCLQFLQFALCRRLKKKQYSTVSFISDNGPCARSLPGSQLGHIQKTWLKIIFNDQIPYKSADLLIYKMSLLPISSRICHYSTYCCHSFGSLLQTL